MGWIKFSYFSEHADLGGVWLLLGLLNRRFAPHNPSAEKLLGRLAVHRLRKEREPANQIVARFALLRSHQTSLDTRRVRLPQPPVRQIEYLGETKQTDVRALRESDMSRFPQRQHNVLGYGKTTIFSIKAHKNTIDWDDARKRPQAITF